MRSGNAPEQIRHRANGAAAIPDSLTWVTDSGLAGKCPRPGMTFIISCHNN
jgi:hypothetical protein